MCLKKRKIKSPIKKEHQLSISKISIDIPCGRCRECRRTRQNDWLVRSYFEFSSKPQDAFFLTLDFDEWNVPVFDSRSGTLLSADDRIEYVRLSSDYQSIPDYFVTCFDHSILQRFIDSLRFCIESKFPGLKFRYLFASDSGVFMSRPHYHGILLFDKNSIQKNVLYNFICRYWHYGKRTNLQTVAKKYKNPYKSIEYICKYCTKDVDFDKIRKREHLPTRFAPKTVASIGWGAQALDPTEFPSERFFKQGVLFMDHPVITKQFLKDNSKIYLDINNDNHMVPFKIPRYYELKLMYNWKWNSKDKREEAILNADGIELSKIRHNVDYNFYYSSFLLSENMNILSEYSVFETFNYYYPASPLLIMTWKEIVDIIKLDLDSFYEFCKVRKYFEYIRTKYDDFGKIRYTSEGIGNYRPLRYTSKYWNPSYSGFDHGYYLASSLSDNLKELYQFIDEDDVKFYIEATFIFDAWNFIRKSNQHSYYEWLDRENQKERARYLCETDPDLYFHLKRHNFNFSKLNAMPYAKESS